MTKSQAMWAVLGTILATWWCTWSTPFVEDDWLYLEAVRSSRTFLSFLTGEGVMDHHLRPVSDAWVFFLHARPAVYHILHTLLLFAGAAAVWSIAASMTGSPIAAAITAVLFAGRDFWFPSMVWASGISDAGSAAFGLSSLALALRWFGGGDARWAVGSIVLAVLAVLTKEVAVVVAPVAVILAWHQRAPARRALLLVLPLAVSTAGIAVVQWWIASFDEGYGASLYELSVGSHSMLRLPVYAWWSFVAIREIEQPAVALGALAALGAGFAFLGFGRGRARSTDARLAAAAALWFLTAIAPALLAPNRFHTNYLGLAAAAPLLIAGVALARGLSVARPLAAVVLVGLWLAGPINVALKRWDKLDSGGWVNLERAERLDDAVRSVAPLVDDAGSNARILILGGLDVDMRVLGDPRGEGFGPQQVLASALRVQTGRYDLDVLSLPTPAQLEGRAADAVKRLLADRSTDVRLIDLGPPCRVVR